MADIIEQSDMLLKDFNSSGYISKYVMEVLPQLVAEIKRLQAQVESQSESIQILCRDLDPQLHHLMKGKQELREQLATWQKITIEERCKAIMLIEKLQDVANNPDWQTRGLSKTHEEYMKLAAKELGLQVKHEAGYVERPEKRLIAFTMGNGPGCTMQEAQDALEKIRRG